MTDTTSAADQLRAAADRARETGDPLHAALALLLERHAKEHDASVIAAARVWPNSAAAAAAWLASQANLAALAVARQVLGTTTGQHTCGNCDGIDPDTCLTNSERTTGQPATGMVTVRIPADQVPALLDDLPPWCDDWAEVTKQLLRDVRAGGSTGQPEAECGMPDFMGCDCNHVNGCQHPVPGAAGQPTTAPWPPAGDNRPDHELYVTLRKAGLDPAPAQQMIDTYTQTIRTGQGAPAVDRAAVLTPAEGQFLAFALDQAAEELSLGAGFTVEAAAALDRLRRLAAEAQQPTPDVAEETKPEGQPLAVGDRYECRTRPRTVTVTRLWVDEYGAEAVAFEWRGGMSGAAHTVDMFRQLYHPAS